MFRPPRLLIALLLAAAGLVLIQAPASSACSCSDANVRQSARSVDVVFRGTVVEQATTRRSRVFSMQVERIYRGRVAETPIEVVSPRGQDSCGVRMQVDRSYVVFGNESERRLSSGRCDGTARATPRFVGQVEGALGEGNPLPQQPEPDAERPAVEFTAVDQGEPPDAARLAAPGAGLVVVALLGLLVFRKRG